jgi:hypothetical protein
VAVGPARQRRRALASSRAGSRQRPSVRIAARPMVLNRLAVELGDRSVFGGRCSIPGAPIPTLAAAPNPRRCAERHVRSVLFVRPGAGPVPDRSSAWPSVPPQFSDPQLVETAQMFAPVRSLFGRSWKREVARARAFARVRNERTVSGPIGPTRFRAVREDSGTAATLLAGGRNTRPPAPPSTVLLRP